MITDEQVLALFSEANPVPVAGAAPPGDLGGVEITPAPPPIFAVPPPSRLSGDRRGGRSPRRKLIAVAVGAAALAAIAVALPLLLRTDGDLDYAREVVRRYFSTRDRWDGAALQEMFTDDAVILEDPHAGIPLDVSDLVPLSEFERALEWRWTLSECSALPIGPAGTQVLSCSYTSENAWTTALGLPPLASDILFNVKDGRITRLEHRFPYGQYETVWATFLLWLTETHPPIADQVIDELSHGQTRPVLTDEAIALWREYSSLFVASIGTQASPEQLAIVENYYAARSRWDGAALQSLFAPDADISPDGVASLSAADLGAHAAWDRAMRTSWTFDGCRSGPPGVADVICTAGAENVWTRALDRPPITFETQFDIDDQRITRLDGDFMSYQFEDLWYGFFAWLDATHPGVSGQLVDEGGFPRPDDATNALWEDYAQRYAAVLAADVAIARDYFATRDHWDGARLAELFSPEAVIVLDGSTELPVADLVGLSEFEHALDWRWSMDECRSAWAVDGESLVCSYGSDNEWTRALGRSPSSADITFTIADGRIVRLEPAFPHEEFRVVWDAFASWLDETHPGVRSRIIRTANGFEIPRLDLEAIALWQEYAPLFVASIDEGAGEQ